MKHWHTHTFYAMGSHMAVWLEVASAEKANEAFSMVESAFEQAEQRMSRFRPDSELNWLNSQAGNWAAVSPPMWNVIEKALTLSAETNGLFDPTIHNALLAAGYRKSFDALNGLAASTRDTVAGHGDWQAVALDPSASAVFLPEGLRLDLGGIGKGFTAQTVVRWLSEWGACLIDAGGDVTAGGAPVGMPGWPVGICAPWTTDQPEQANIIRLWLANATLATSGIDYRQWTLGDATAHHIIDPRTGFSAETDLLTCSIIAADACSAEAWATATLVAGAQHGYHALADRNIAATLINHEYHITLTPTMQPIAQWEQAN